MMHALAINTYQYDNYTSACLSTNTYHDNMRHAISYKQNMLNAIYLVLRLHIQDICIYTQPYINYFEQAFNLTFDILMGRLVR